MSYSNKVRNGLANSKLHSAKALYHVPPASLSPSAQFPNKYELLPSISQKPKHSFYNPLQGQG